MVTSSPVPFTALPRVVGSDTVDTVYVQGKLAPAIDTEYNRVNTWHSSSWANRFKPVKVTNLVTLITTGAQAWKWFTPGSYNEGLILGDVRQVSLKVAWNGDTYLETDAYGGITDIQVGTLADSRFWPGGSQEIWFAGDASNSMSLWRIDGNGKIWLCGFSSLESYLNVDEYVAVNATYMVYA